MEERRRSPRHRVYKAGTIAFNRAGGVRCIVRNISETGACLQFDNPFGIPGSFDLVITSDQASHHCDVMWRAGHRMGVAFC
jgi:hypothetical protein